MSYTAIKKECVVYFGRGKGHMLKPGNVKYRKEIAKYTDAYKATTDNRVKNAIAHAVVKSLRKQGATFLQGQDHPVGNAAPGFHDWKPLSKHIVIKKVKQSLRDSKTSTVNSSSSLITQTRSTTSQVSQEAMVAGADKDNHTECDDKCDGHNDDVHHQEKQKSKQKQTKTLSGLLSTRNIKPMITKSIVSENRNTSCDGSTTQSRNMQQDQSSVVDLQEEEDQWNDRICNNDMVVATSPTLAHDVEEDYSSRFNLLLLMQRDSILTLSQKSCLELLGESGSDLLMGLDLDRIFDES